ncbi:LysR family transcriptional regulator [Celeribacter sp. PS-C1]|nr:LysR family transcriptional regulator [Celeribacter sp. PS-C1]MBW6417212.1 LysR family transcriptional regulator [Celeribacter sp. PS-C1]
MERWDDLHILLAIDKYGTMAAAARMLGTNPATVSRRMERLSDELGMNPVIKTSKGWGPNPEMRALIEVSDAFWEGVRAEKNRLRMRAGMKSSEIRIACSPMMLRHILTPNMKHYATELANIRLIFSNRALITTLSGHDIIIAAVPPESGRVVSRKIGVFALEAYAPKESVESSDWVGLPSEYADFPIMQKCEQYFGGPPRIEVDTLGQLHEVMASARIGGFVPVVAAQDLEEFEAIEDSYSNVDIFMSYHESRRGDPALTAVTKFIIESFAKSPWGQPREAG